MKNNTGSGIDKGLKSAYWGVVEDCLVRFHHLSKGSAHGKSNAFRRKLDNAPPGIDGDFFYHNEPFYVACNIAGIHSVCEQENILEKHASEYKLILEARRW